MSSFLLRWLKWVSQKEGIHILHARNGLEQRVGSLKVDGMSGNTVFEFNGCNFPVRFSSCHSYVSCRSLPRLSLLLLGQGIACGEQSDDGGAVPEHSGQAAVSREQRVKRICSLTFQKRFLQVHASGDLGLRVDAGVGDEQGDVGLLQAHHCHRSSRPSRRFLRRAYRTHHSLLQTQGGRDDEIHRYLQVCSFLLDFSPHKAH